jgi:hypothetical protein
MILLPFTHLPCGLAGTAGTKVSGATDAPLNESPDTTKEHIMGSAEIIPFLDFASDFTGAVSDLTGALSFFAGSSDALPK